MSELTDSPEASGPAEAVAESPSAASGRRSRWGLLAQRDFRLLWTGETSSGFGNYVTSVALPLIAVTTLHSSPLAIGVLAAAVWLPWLVIGLPVGAWVDRLPKRPVMITCNLVSATLFLSVPVAWWLDTLTIGHLVAVGLLSGCSTVFFSTAYHVYLPTIVDEPHLMEGNAKLQGSESATQVVGPGLGGIIAQAFGAVMGLLIDALSFLVSTVCLLRIRATEPPPERPEQRENLRKEISEGLRFVVSDPYLRPIVTYGAMANLALDGYQAVQVVFMVRTVGVGSATVGALIAAAGIGGILGAMVAGPIGRRFGTARGMLICQLGAAPFGLLMPLTSPGFGLLFFVVGSMMVVAGLVASNITLNSFRQSYCPPRLLGRVVATTMFLNYSTIPIGALLGGALGTYVGTRPTMWIMTVLLLLCSLILLLGPIRKTRDFPTGPRVA
jgi:predicted MFS family arabinose efflux permease